MFYIVIPLLFSTIILIQNNNALDVTIEQGTLRGSIFLSRNNSEYFGFLGIPFAKPPIGDLRFKPPQAPEAWNGIRDATLPPPKCIQKEIFSYDDHLRDIEGQEDCLYLNLFVPSTAGKKTHPMPVMVYMHGGAFIVGGAGFHEPTYFMDHDVIIVVIQYRLNILGFLSTGDDVLPGNNGMKDQVMALKWVQKNIAAFGGDPNQVTIFGESAGGTSVHYHLYWPLSKGLFHRAISQSGTSLALWAHESPKLARHRALALGLLTACPISDTLKLVNCLRKIPARELVLAHNKFYVWDVEPVIPFSIVTEPSSVEGAFITENPWYQDTVSNVPLIIGMNSAEGGVKATRYLHDNGAKAKYINANYKRLLPISLYYGYWIEDREKVDRISESIKKFYFGDKNIGTETFKEFIRLYTDGYFAFDILEAAKRYKGPAYFYYYDHRNKRTFNEIFGVFPEDLGVCHADDLISLFHLNGFVPKVTEGDDLKVSERLVKYWVNFAINGNPNGNNVVWTPIQTKDIEYLHITTHRDQMEKGLLKERYFDKEINVLDGVELAPDSNSNANIVRTSKGNVSGIILESRDGSKYHAYLGMPFAKPPVGGLRFQDPKEADSWTGVLVADKYAPGCPQSGWESGKDILGEEDCLYLNVFTPTVNDSANLSVLVWIYGGGFVIGDASIYGPDYIMDKNVVFVSFNYRIGALGFLSADDRDLQGNYGMKDQVAALKWIKNNIKAFGGSAEKITIAGSSAGGASVHWHMLSPLSKGLFHRAISQSGTANAIWSEIPPHIAKRRALSFATLAGCYYPSTIEMVECLREIPTRDIINIQRKFKIWNHNPLIFGVVVNNYSENSFALKTAWNDNSSEAQIPWMVGITSDEGATLITGLLSDNGTWIDDLNANRNRLLPMLLMLQYFENVTKNQDEDDIANILLKWYFKDKPISKDTVDDLKKLVADSYVLYPATESFLKHNATKYFYVYDHVNRNSFAEFEPNIVKKNLGAVHCDDLVSLFRTSYFPKNLTGDDKQVSKFMVDLWINFVIHGNPNGASNTSNETLWRPVSDNNLKYLRIGKNASMETWYWKERYEFWKSLKLQRSSNAHRNIFSMIYFTNGLINRIFLAAIAVMVGYFSTRNTPN